MPKRKFDSDGDSDNLSVPLPIQTFFWRQTSPFIRPKTGKVQEASCMEQREACKVFEKVLVQNIQFGLSPSLTEAIKSISRWRLIQASLPYVMHCCAALLYNRKDSCTEKLGSAETKLLYTLHWILLDAAEECMDAEIDRGIIRPPGHYLFSITTMQVFVYLFAPLMECLNHSDFLTSFRLENGLKLWEPFWEYRHPDVGCFTSHVRPRRTFLKANRNKNAHTKFGDVFLGAEDRNSMELIKNMVCQVTITSPEKMDSGPAVLPEETLSSEGLSQNVCDVCQTEPSTQNGSEQSTCKCGKLSISESAPGTSTDQKDGASKKAFPLKPTLSDVSMATYLDVAVLRCLFISQWLEEGVYWAFQFLYNRLRDIAEEQSQDWKPRKRSSSLPIPTIEISFYQSPEQKRREFGDTFSDGDKMCGVESPFPPPSHHSSMQELRHSSLSGPSDKPKQKRMKIGDFRAFVEEKLRLSERLLDKLTKDDSRSSSISEDQDVALIIDTENMTCESKDALPLVKNPRPQSALAMIGDKSSKSENSASAFKSEMIRGKSLPSLHLVIEKPTAEIMSKLGKLAPPFTGKKVAHHTHSVPNPIITITEHSPVASVQFFLNQDSAESPQEESPPASALVPPCHQFYITRSQTDSNITYTPEDLQEAPGSAHYITKDGEISYIVVLKAIHAVTLRENACSLRVCEVILNLIELLLSLGLLPKKEPKEKAEQEHKIPSEKPTESGGATGSATMEEPSIKQPYMEKSKSNSDKKNEELTVHNLFMNVVLRVIKHLGCPHGCGEGHRSPIADVLRTQTLNILTRLDQADPLQFRKFLRNMINQHALTEVLDFFHSFVGFCSEQGTLLSPLNQKRSGTVPGQDNGYANNFGGGLTSVYGKGPAAAVLGHVFKPLVTRLVQNMKDLKSQENMALYCDIRQLMTYIRDNHGGVFRRVALSGLLDSADRPHKKDQSSTPSTRIVRHSKSVDHDDYSREIISSPTVFVVNETVPEKSSRKSFFRRRGIRKAPSNQSVFDDREDHSVCASPALGQSTSSLLRHHRAVTPRLSVSEEGAHSLQRTPKSSRRRFPIVHWLKGERVKHARQRWSKSGSASPVLSKSYPGSERLSRRASCISRTSKLGQKSSSQMSLTLSRARKRMEDHLNKIGIGRNKNKYGSFEEPLDLSRRNSFDLEHGARDGDLLVVKESKLVNIQLVRDGMFRFAFLMETCHPGTIPDPPLMAAALDLKAPVVARAALYLECAHFIHRCNKGQWPTWMKLNLPMFRPSGPLGNRGTPSGLRRTHILQRAAGRMFYQWAEAIGARLEEMLQREQCDSTENLLAVVDENKKRQYRIEDDEEDFLDEACVNPMGNNCPYALKMAACQLLLEITAFLRETYQYLPHKSSRLSTREKHCFEPRSVTANRRWSMALSSLGFSQNSAHSLVSLAEQGHPFALNERRISFVLHEADAEVESENSSNTTLTVQEDPNCGDEKKGRRIAQGRTHLLRRTPGSAPCHNSSFKRRSLKLKKPVDRKNRPRSSTFAEDDDESYLKRTESIHSRRKVSAVSDRSDTSERADVSGEESPGVLSDEQAPESPNDVLESDDVSLTKNMPWLKVLVQVSSSLNFSCPHQHFCHPNCYRRQMRACNRLVKAVRKVYGDEIGVVKDTEKQPEDKEDSKKEKKLKKIITAPSSPLRRKASVAHNLDKIEKAVDAPHLGALRSLHSSITCLAHDVEAGGTADKGEQKLGPYVKKEPKEELPIVKYLKNQVMTLFHSPLSTLVKGTVVMSDNCFKDIMNVVWKLLLESDQQLAATAAALFTISSVKAPDQASELLEKELKHEDTAQRINAIHRFHALWQFRNQCWPRMEDGAQMYFKVPPPVVEFTLPSPKIAIDSVPIADPPWLPHVKTKVEEVTINQDQSLQRSFVTATKTRRKQQVELIHRALEAEEDKKQTARENFPITSVAVNLHAAYEPALYHAVEEHEEGEEDALTERNMQHHIQMAHPLFPSCLCSSTFHIISLLDDPQVNIDGVAVYEVAYKVIWLCLVEDTALFMRHFLEKLTREKQDVILQILRKLLHFIPRLPPQAAYTLYNYFIGYIMFYVRTPVEGGQELIANALSLVWLVVPSVQGLFFKDLKQILRKEQCDASLLITANVPSAKKIIIHGPDVGGIPSQFPVHEDTQFLHVLQDSFEFFGIEEAEQNSYFLVDTKTNQIHNLESFVRDFYFFKRSQYPQLSLVQMDPEQAFQRQQQQALTLKFLELGKVLMTVSVLKTTNQVLQRVLVLHEELMKLPSFPRKALEADFSLYAGNLGKEMLGIDTLHKLVWVKLVARMFEVMAGFFAHSSDIHLFVNVVNGALVLHCEDCTILRQCLATFINAAQQFKNIFASNGYLLIMPTILRIYSNHQTNSLLCRSIEFVSKQFYIMHRKPFILQMFGSAASILDLDTTSMYGDANKVQSKAFFQLLLSFGQYIVDPLDILGLVKGEKPLRALDFCYQMDPDTLTIQDCISLCVTVVAYAPDSQRGHQMLTILEAVLPFYLNHLQSQTLKKETPGGARTEIQAIHSISVCMKTLITNCEVLARNYTGPHRAIDLRGSSIKNASKGACSPPFEVDEDSHSNFYISRRQQQSQYDRHVEDSEILRAEFRKPRDTILFVISEFLTTCTRRLATLSKKVPDLTSKATELLDLKCHLRLAEIAHSLLKVSPYDPATMACRGLHRYMNEVLPNTEWVQEAMRPALIMVLRRLDKTFNKIAKKQTIKRLVDWEAARSLLKGVYLTLYKHTYIAHLPHLKSLTAVCQGILLGDNYTLPLATESLSTFNTSLAALSQSPPASFVSVAVRLIAMQMLALGDSLTLESVCGGVSAVCSSPEKTEIYLMNLILPMCVRVTSGIKDSLRLCQMDISFALAVIIHGLTPPQSKNTSTGKSVSEGQGPEKSPRKPRSSLFQIGFLGLKVMIVCFEHELAGEWYKIARCIRELGNKLFGGLALWNFLDFVVTHRTPLFILLYPLIKYRILQTICDNEQEYYYQQLIREKLQGFSLPTPKSRGTLLMDLVAEMKALKDDLVSRKLDSYSIGDISQSTSYTRSVIGGAHRPSFTELTSDQHSVTRLGNPPGLVSTGSCHGRGVESRGSVTSHKSGLSHQWSVRSDSNVPSRGLSIRLHSRDRSQKVVERFLRRTSYPEHEGAISQDILEGDQAASSEPRLFRKSTLYIKMRGSKKSCGGGSQSSIIGGEEGVDVERSQENITGWRAPTSQPTSRPTSPSGIHSPDHDSDSHRPRHRLQRQKAQSRKTFRFRKSRRSAGFAVETKQPTEEIPMATTMKQLTLAEEGSLCVNESDVTSIIPEVDFFPKQKTVVEETTVDYHAPRRRGAVHMRSHSPSPSPEGPSLPLFPSKDTYITQKESNESLSNSENAALLKEEEKPKSNSQSSLLLVFPKDAETTCV